MRTRKLLTVLTTFVFLMYPGAALANPVSTGVDLFDLFELLLYGAVVFVILAVSIKLIRVLAGKISGNQTVESTGDPGNEDKRP